MKKLLFFLIIFPYIIYAQNIIELAEANNLMGIQQAVQKGIDVNTADDLGFTALHIAAWNGYTDIVRYLLDQGANPNVISKAGNTPLRFANPEITRLLKRYGAFSTPKKAPLPQLFYSPNIYIEKTSPQPAYIRPPIYHAVAPPVTKIISNFTTNFISNTIYVSNFITNTIYDYPKKSYERLNKLTPQESMALHNWDVDGNNALHRMAKKGSLDDVIELINQGINPNSRNINGDTALRFAAENGHIDIVKYLIEDAGVDVNSANNDGTTALMMATINNNPDLISYLARMGANVNATATAMVQRTVDGIKQEFEVSGWTALMAAAQMGFNEAIEALLNSGANLNATDGDHWNALMFAVQNGFIDTARYLLKLGINYNIESKDKHTAMSLAIDNADQGIVDLLSNVGAIHSSIPLLQINSKTTTEIVPPSDENNSLIDTPSSFFDQFDLTKKEERKQNELQEERAQLNEEEEMFQKEILAERMKLSQREIALRYEESSRKAKKERKQIQKEKEKLTKQEEKFLKQIQKEKEKLKKKEEALQKEVQERNEKAGNL